MIQNLLKEHYLANVVHRKMEKSLQFRNHFGKQITIALEHEEDLVLALKADQNAQLLA